MNKFLIVEAEAYLNGEIANTTLVNLTGNIFTVSNSACEDSNFVIVQIFFNYFRSVS